MGSYAEEDLFGVTLVTPLYSDGCLTGGIYLPAKWWGWCGPLSGVSQVHGYECSERSSRAHGI